MKTIHALLTVAVIPLMCAFVCAQKSQVPPTAPVPPQIASAQKIFIANGGGESFETVFDQVVFDGGPDRPYNEFYATMKTWGQRQIVSSPADADLVFEISWVLSDTGLGRLPILGQLRLIIVDPKTHSTLWTINEYVRGAVLLGNRDKNFDHTINTIMNRVRMLLLPAAAAPADR